MSADGERADTPVRWMTAFVDMPVDSYAVGIGSSLPGDLSDLNYIHNIDSLGQGGGTVDEALIVTDVSELESELLSTVPTAFGANRWATFSISTTRCDAATNASRRPSIGVDPACDSMPLTVASNQRWPCPPVTTPMDCSLRSRIGPCSMCASMYSPSSCSPQGVMPA